MELDAEHSGARSTPWSAKLDPKDELPHFMSLSALWSDVKAAMTAREVTASVGEKVPEVHVPM
jgi:hypothetical protein